ncbi:hypothetical protein M413DRAFT_40033, partial [Hebeloma cylindrosporum]
DMLFSLLSPADLIAYSKTCRASRYSIKSFYRRAFRIEKTLRRFFAPDEIQPFRELQAMTGMIISGSTVLEFFDRTEYADSDLDLYVEHKRREPVVLWLESIGYKFIPRPSSGPPTLEIMLLDDLMTHSDGISPPTVSEYRDAMLVLDFKRAGSQRIQLITSTSSPFELVLHFHSTCVMNIITHDKAYSVFPRATFEERRSLVHVKDTDSTALTKYEERGWQLIQDIKSEDPEVYSMF